MNSMPVFVKIEDYKRVLELIENLKAKLDNAKSVIEHIEQLKNQEDAEIEKCKERLENLTTKVTSIDNILTTPDN